MYQNGHPTHWFLEINGQRIEVEDVGDAAEKLISATFAAVAEEQTQLTETAIDFKIVVEALRSTIQNWYQIQMAG